MRDLRVGMNVSYYVNYRAKGHPGGWERHHLRGRVKFLNLGKTVWVMRSSPPMVGLLELIPVDRITQEVNDDRQADSRT